MEYKKGYWITQFGDVIKISNMSTNHIRNTIGYLESHRDFYDIATMVLPYDIDSFDYEDNSHLVDEKIKELKEELKNRDIYEFNRICSIYIY